MPGKQIIRPTKQNNSWGHYKTVCEVYRLSLSLYSIIQYVPTHKMHRLCLFVFRASMCCILSLDVHICLSIRGLVVSKVAADFMTAQ